MNEASRASLTGYGPSTTRIRNLSFDGDPANFEAFEVKFKAYLRLRKIKIDVVSEDEEVLEEENAEIYAELVQTLDSSSLALIMRDGAENGREALKILREHYLPKGKPRIISLYTQLSCIVKMQSESVTDYIIRAETAASQLRDAGENISDGLLVAMVLKGLPKDFHSFITVITQENEMTFQTFKVRLRNFEDTVKMSENEPETETATGAIMNIRDKPTWAKPNGKFNGKCFKCDKVGHRASDCYITKRWCEICKSKSHDTKDCRKLQKLQELKEDVSEPTYFFSIDSQNNVVNRDQSFLVDSGATTHVLNDKSKFISFEKNFKPEEHVIQLADGTRTSSIVKGQGEAKVTITDENGCKRNVVFNKALYIPSFKQNIFSVKIATDHGAIIQFSKDSAKLISNNTSFNIQKEGKLYFLNSSVHKSKASHTLFEWHIILGHCNKNDILKLEENCDGMHITDKSDFDCEICKVSKMTDVFSRQPDTSTKENFELVHTDLAGPVDPSDINGMNYSLICVDSFSKFIYPYFLKQKSDAYKAFNQYLADIAPYGQVKSVRSDVGGEFIAENFKSVLLENKIQQQLTAPYSPHQNGKAERTWRTLFEMARCLLSQSGLPKSLWTYAVMAAAYIRNRCYHKSIDCTPYEKVTGRKPNIANMKPFGSVCYALVQNPKKLDNRSEKGIFLGFDRTSPAHLVYFPDTNSVKKIRCVQFPKHSQVTQGGNGYVDFHFDFDSPSKNVKTTESDENHDNEDPDLHSQSAPEQPENVEEKQDSNVRKRNKPQYLNDYLLDNDIDSLDALFDTKNSDDLHTTIHYCYNTNFCHVPQSYSEAISSKDASKWDLAMKNEMQALEENDTFELVSLPEGKQMVGSKWVYAIKTDKNGDEHYKARFVAKGFSQIEGIDYQETFSPTARMTSIRAIAQIAVQNDMEIHQMDVKAAYLNAPIDCDVYVRQPEGFVKGIQNDLVFKLKKSLYGLKQSGRNWNNTLDTFLKSEGFHRSVNDTCFYTKNNIFLVHWVDDILIAAKPCILKSVKASLEKRFKMKDLGKVSFFLGIEFESDTKTLSICQSRYISRVLTRFRMHDCKPRSTPCEMNPNQSMNHVTDSEPLNEQDLKTFRQIVGALIYIMVATRPDISFIVTRLSQFMSCAQQNHMIMARHVLRYLKGTMNDKMVFTKSTTLNITGFCDADWANGNDRKSITGYCFRITEKGPMISWNSRKQQTVALSSCEAEYMSLCSAVQEGKYLISFLNEILDLNQISFDLSCDNQGAIALAKNPVNHKRSKHIDIKYHFVRDEIIMKRLCVKYISTEENVADILTKPVSSKRLNKFQSVVMG